MRLSILIPTTPDRTSFVDELKRQFLSQLGRITLWTSGENGIDNFSWRDHVELITLTDNKENSIGTKRNILLKESEGKYVAFIDSDDRISDNYFELLFQGIETGVDCCSLKGIITEDGNNPLVFEHSIKYYEYKTNPEGMPVRYERYPNHLNCIKASIAKQFKFPEINHSEDTQWATQIFKSGLLKTEHYIPEILYYYDYRSKK